MMQSKVKKIVYTDSGIDKGITGHILSEDDFFLTVDSFGRIYRIGKKAIIAVKEVKQWLI